MTSSSSKKPQQPPAPTQDLSSYQDFCNLLVKLGACSPAQRWLATCSSPEEAWSACGASGWLMWVCEKARVPDLPKLVDDIVSEIVPTTPEGERWLVLIPLHPSLVMKTGFAQCASGPDETFVPNKIRAAVTIDQVLSGLQARSRA